MRLRWTIVVVLAAMFAVAGGVLVTPPAPQPVTVIVAADPLAQRIERAQQRLRELPGDWRTWTELGISYVEQARITGDPAYYTRAQAALAQSERLHPSNPDTLIGFGMLANARHDFEAAARFGREAVLLNPYSSDGYLVLADAYTQLGQAEAATGAVHRALDLDPGLPALARAAYDLQLRGDLSGSREMWLAALRQAASPAETSFVRQQLGDLALAAGDLDIARTEYTLAGYRYGLAKLDRDLPAYAELAASAPTPTLLAEYAVLLRQDGRHDDADATLALADAALGLLEANGGTDHLAAAEVALARGDCVAARELARRELDRRTHVDVIRTHERAMECQS